MILNTLLRILLKYMYRVKVEGLEHLQEAGERVLIIANHTSFLDAALLKLFLPGDISFAIDKSYVRLWWMQPVKRLVRLFAIDHSDPMAMKGLIKYIKEGHRVVIFPEGRITSTGSLMKIYPGPGMVADKANASILPIRVDGAQYTPFSHLRGKVRLRWFPPIRLSILSPRKLELSEHLSARERRREAGRVLADMMSEMVFETTPYHRRLWDSLAEAMDIHGKDHVIVEDMDRIPLNYKQLIMRAFLLGGILKKQLKQKGIQGTYIGILLPNAVSTIITFFALQSRGAVPAMLNFTMGEKALLMALETADIHTVLTSRRFVETANLQGMVEAIQERVELIFLEDLRAQATVWRKLKAWRAAAHPNQTIRWRLKRVCAEDTAVVLFTSGSEGIPKGVALSHRNLLANLAQISSRIAFNAHDVCLNALPMFHSFGLTGGTLLPLLSGMKLFLYPTPLHYRVIPELAYDISATLLFGTNVFLAAYAKCADPYDFHSLRYVIAGAEKLQDSTRHLWQEKFGIRILEGYGATETSPVLSVNTPMAFRRGSVGRLLPGIEARIETIEGIKIGGRLWVRGANVMVGYLLHDAPGRLQPPENGWYDTGDIVEIDADGFVHIQGRVRRFAKVAGEMVSLTVTEEMAMACWPEALHVALAVSHAEKGEQIVLLSTHTEARRRDLIAFSKAEHIPELQVPRILLVVSEIPLTGSGKVNYPAVQMMVEQSMSGDDAE